MAGVTGSWPSEYLLRHKGREIRYSVFELKIVTKCPVNAAIKLLTSVLCLLSVFTPTFLPSLDKILAAMTIAAERNNKERFASIVEGLENHEAQQLQVWTHCKDNLPTVLS